MKTDIQIAQEAKMEHIRNVAERFGLTEEDLEFYGKYKAKISDQVWERVKNNPDGKLVLVTAINPTPAGEGKTTISIGLAQALNQMGKKTWLALREPSLGPCFGIKGGAAGGGYAQVVPMEDLNLHFTGDFHAITSANNLLAAMLDNHIQQGNELRIDTRQVTWKRCLDMNDRVLRNVVVGLGAKADGYVREDHFVITVASEIMAILCLCNDMKDLKERLGRIIVAYNVDGEPVTAKDLKAVGAMAALLKDAIQPNMIQTLEHTPALVHGGPFANIAHGCNSVRATKTALKLGEIAVTEAGFGADLGAEKFMDIKCRMAGLKPDAVVLVATVKALKYNGGVPKNELGTENLEALKKGIVNLEKHIENIQKFGVPVVVTLNSFLTDTEAEYELIKNFFPGPLTIILKKKENISNMVTANKETVGVRMPQNDIALKLIEYAGVPIATPSANISGKPSGTNMKDIMRDFEKKVEYFIDNGSSKIGQASTIVQIIDETPYILRKGAISELEIKKVIDKKRLQM